MEEEGVVPLQVAEVVAPVAPRVSSPTWKRGQCRYGFGCTHITDEAHCARYWHPEAPQQSQEISGNTYICNECGFLSDDPCELKLHLQRKTAWSNHSLVGCHVSVLLDNRDWQDGIVTQYHKSGKHCVEFQMMNQKRWLQMLKTAFYIVERPVPDSRSESKEAETDCASSTGENSELTPIDKWSFCEEITTEYAIAQSTIHRVYGNKIQETGHRTAGHLCVTEDDRKHANSTRGSLLYGELLPRGVNRALDSRHLGALKQGQRSLLDLGMGTGKVVMQVFLQCPNLTFVYGVELSLARFRIAQFAALKLVETEMMDDGTGLMIPRFEVVEHVKDHILRVRDRAQMVSGSSTGASSQGHVNKERFLYLEWNNLLESSPFIFDADMVLLETDIPADTMLRLACLLYQMKPGARILSYLDLSKIWEGHGQPFSQLDINKSLIDRFPTSWSVHRGHHFFLWAKVGRSMPDMFSYYTSYRRIPVESVPPYPTHSASIIRHILPSSLGGTNSRNSSGYGPPSANQNRRSNSCDGVPMPQMQHHNLTVTTSSETTTSTLKTTRFGKSNHQAPGTSLDSSVHRGNRVLCSGENVDNNNGGVSIASGSSHQKQADSNRRFTASGATRTKSSKSLSLFSSHGTKPNTTNCSIM